MVWMGEQQVSGCEEKLAITCHGCVILVESLRAG